MPLVEKYHLKDRTTVGIWELVETEEELMNPIDLSQLEAERLSDRNNPLKRKQFLAARHLLKELIGEKKSIQYKKSGKPFLEESNRQISISHSDRFVALALTEVQRVGVDIEVGRRPSLAKVPDYFLNDEEMAEVLIMKVDLEQLSLYWSAKEALYKYMDDEKLDIRTSFRIFPFEIKEQGLIEAQSLLSGFQQKVILSYFRTSDYVLVVTGK